MAALRKSLLKTFLAQERQKSAQELVKMGLSHEEAVTHTAADQALVERAAVRARLASRESAACRRNHAATATPAPAPLDEDPAGLIAEQ